MPLPWTNTIAIPVPHSRTPIETAGSSSASVWTHLNLALRFGRARPENVLADDELISIASPVLFIWGKDDVYGAPEIGQRATRRSSVTPTAAQR